LIEFFKWMGVDLGDWVVKNMGQVSPIAS
jgi:hypothetical protein